MKMNIREKRASAMGRLFCALILALLTVRTLSAQSFSLDDNPFAPIIGPPGIGFGAENPFGIVVPGHPPGLAPSPTLGLIGPLGDGAILSPSPAPGIAPPLVQHPGPDGFYVASMSSNKAGLLAPLGLSILFSVDRQSIGLPGTAVAAEAALSQAPGDVYATTASFVDPSVFAGGLVSIGFLPLPSFAGYLPAGPPIGGNALLINQGLPVPGIPGFGLFSGPGAVLPPGVPAPPIAPGTHDNVDGFDTAFFEVTGDIFFDANHYFSIYPAEAAVAGVSSADLFLAAAGTPGAIPVPFAPSLTLGLDTLGPHPIVGTPFSDSVDALVMWDNGIDGTLEPGIDYALFSLGTGSASLGALAGLVNDSDVLFTDFTGLFAVYAPAGALGLLGDPAGGFFPRPYVGIAGPIDGLDALDVVPIPEPASLVLATWTLALVWGLAGGRR
ncbi:MAG: hypothetical protein WD669_13400 [Pirellulales bacterium]